MRLPELKGISPKVKREETIDIVRPRNDDENNIGIWGRKDCFGEFLESWIKRFVISERNLKMVDRKIRNFEKSQRIPQKSEFFENGFWETNKSQWKVLESECVLCNVFEAREWPCFEARRISHMKKLVTNKGLEGLSSWSNGFYMRVKSLRNRKAVVSVIGGEHHCFFTF